MKIEEIAKRIAELRYPNKPNAIIDEPYRLVRMKALRQQVETELKNCFIPDVISCRLSELEVENRKLKFIIENGLGEKDWENDCL